MKIELKPGVSPAFFWTTIGVGAASTAAAGLSLTAYAWAGMAASILGIVITFLQSRKGPPTP